MEPSLLPDSTACQFRQLHHHLHHPLPHHHHYYHVLPQCPLHSYMLHFTNYQMPTCRFCGRSHPPSQNHLQTALSSNPLPTTLNFQISGAKLPDFSSQGGVHKQDEELEEEEHQQLCEEEEEDEEQDPVFVLTDEWREFFAISEAKRRQAKKQSRKGGKNRVEQ